MLQNPKTKEVLSRTYCHEIPAFTNLPVLSIFSALADDHGKHLFVLSGQSNMQGHRSDEAFTPMVEKALGKEKVIVVQGAFGWQPIHRWWKAWKNPEGEKPNEIGDLYDHLIWKVNAAIERQEIKTVCFVCVQRKRDARMSWGKLRKPCSVFILNWPRI